MGGAVLRVVGEGAGAGVAFVPPPGWGEDLGPVPVQGHRAGAQRAADLACDGGAGDAVVAVGVVGGVPAELVPGRARRPAGRGWRRRPARRRAAGASVPAAFLVSGG